MELSFAVHLPLVAVAAAILYATFHLVLIVGLFRLRKDVPTSSYRISVLVAARNESEHVGDLLQALRDQTRTPDEIIIVDDRSEDGTSAVIEAFRPVLPQLQVLRIDHVPQSFAPKKHALLAGIHRSTGEILCFTDADCLPPPTWIAQLESAFGPTTGVVSGLYAPVWDDRFDSRTVSAGFLRCFIDYERFKTSALQVASIGVGFPWLASGSNLAYRRSVFDEVGGYASHQGAMSGDDDLLIQRVRHSSVWNVSAVAGPEATVRTHLPTRWGEFIRQRTRHFSAGRYYDTTTSLLLALYHGSNIIAVAALIAAFFQPIGLFSTAYVIKLSADLALLVAADLRLHRSRAWTWFIPLELLNVLYIAVVGPLGWMRRVRWKEGTPA